MSFAYKSGFQNVVDGENFFRENILEKSDWGKAALPPITNCPPRKAPVTEFKKHQPREQNVKCLEWIQQFNKYVMFLLSNRVTIIIYYYP